ncbi:glycoside hydrolase family 47 protein [Xylona heveae TC161]|uniref:alpha-1,2-Mannosidase n=1 Tax=Xylona heveae (strain CBS 132557 / TC161) TaxID=1328760 RepID=A0A165IVQ3_XYLHT|nr:glycoside hydrolase family 47 protein [Xylona heveae TC161]KZF25448.1 glycoside hydrolase family 47 protein [Xylona heveae TC161]
MISGLRLASYRLIGLAFGSVILLYLLFRHVDINRGDLHFYGLGNNGPRKVQYAAFEDSGVDFADVKRAEEVLGVMKETFWKYRSKAWGHDDIKPISGKPRETRNGWGAFIVDSSTTVAVMGLSAELELEIDHIIEKIDFDKARGLVDPFETTIRYLGGMISLIELIDGGVAPDTPRKKRDRLLDKAKALARKLGPAYDTPSGLPWPRIDFENDSPGAAPKYVIEGHPAVAPARAGTNYLENRVLSRLTGDPVYTLNATKAWGPMVWPKDPEELPGIIDAPIDIITGKAAGHDRTWDSGHDSYYEYLIKAYIMAPNEPYAATYRDRWIQAVDSLRKHLISRSAAPGGGKGHLFLGKNKDGVYENEMSHLAHFVPGNLLLGGKYLDRKDIVELGLELLEGCHHTYTVTPTKVGPEKFSWIPEERSKQNASETMETEIHRKQWEQYGFWANEPTYKLRPEYVESVFYAWRLTGDPKYREWNWEAFTAIRDHCHAAHGYSDLRDVMNATAPQGDNSESFWTAETLKYLYLTFVDPSHMNLDEWVFTTEAHPVRISTPEIR